MPEVPKKPPPEEKVHIPVPKAEPPPVKGIFSDGMYLSNIFFFLLFFVGFSLYVSTFARLFFCCLGFFKCIIVCARVTLFKAR